MSNVTSGAARTHSQAINITNEHLRWIIRCSLVVNTNNIQTARLTRIILFSSCNIAHRARRNSSRYTRREHYYASPLYTTLQIEQHFNMDHVPHMDWSVPNPADTFKLFKQRIELYFIAKRIAIEDQVVHILLQVGDEGLRRYNSWTMSEEEKLIRRKYSTRLKTAGTPWKLSN